MTKLDIVNGLRATFGDVVTRQQVLDWCSTNTAQVPNWLMNDQSLRVSRGMYRLPQIDALPGASDIANAVEDPEYVPVTEESSTPASVLAKVDSNMDFMLGKSLVPAAIPCYVQFGNFKVIKAAIAARQFYPIFVTGLSGNGKTASIEQACHELNRECFRVNITCETDEDDLLGGFRLKDGATVFHYGPVIHAMKRGAVLLIDEIDLASSKIMCLQSILEGNGVYLKKIGEFVKPSAGFTVIATANTKGQGSDSGKFVGTSVMNEAFLDRFPATIQQEYPPANTERKILTKLLAVKGKTAEQDTSFVDVLVQWANSVRRAYSEGVVDEVISTRRLIHIINGYVIYSDRKQAIDLSISRFNEETRKTFMDFYTKFDATLVSEDMKDQTPVDGVAVADGSNPFA